MNSIERVNDVLNGKIPDRVPLSQHNFMLAARLAGVTDFAAFFLDGEAMAEAQILTWKRFGHDILTLENGTAALAQACGVQVVYQSSTAPVAKEPAIKSLDEVDKLKLPDPYTDPVLSQLLKATRLVVNEIGDRAFVMGRADQGPFSLSCEIRGMTEFMMDLVLDEQPDKIHQLLDFCREANLRYGLAQMAQGAHCTSIGDSPSGPDLLSPRHYRKWAYPYVCKLVEDYRARGVRLSYHICGNATPIVEDMVRTGAAILELDQKAEMRGCKAAAQGKTTILGPIEPSEVMTRGTPALVLEKAREALEVLAPGGGFILGPGCALPATTPEENLDALREAVEKWGAVPVESSFKTTGLPYNLCASITELLLSTSTLKLAA